MTIARFVYQLDAANAVSSGVILNVGANEDPAHIKNAQNDDRKVINCDLFAHDDVIDRPNNVDVLFDCARDRWPFDDNSAELVIMGDIVEHLSTDEIKHAFAEAKRVSKRLVVTCPEDDRPETFEDRSDRFPRGAVHVTLVTQELLQECLDETGWKVVDWQQPHYGFVPRGHFVTAE